MKRSLASLLMCVMLMNCAAPANPPSLLPRAIESRSSAESQPTSPVVLPVIDPVLSKELAAFVAEARAGSADFASAERSGATALAVGKGAPFGSESWIAAELVRSALQVARQRSAAALTDIDALAVTQNDRASRDATVGGLPEIQAAQTQVEAIVAGQTARLDALNR